MEIVIVVLVCLTAIIIVGLITNTLDKRTQAEQAIALESLAVKERLAGWKEDEASRAE